MGVTTVPEERLRQIIQGDALGTVSELQFRDLDHFCAGSYTTTWDNGKK